MVRILSRNIFRFFLLIFLQILIFNNIQLSGYINPYFYILFILLLPFETPGWTILLSGFLLGLMIDLFMHTPGMHAAATVFIAFLRPSILEFIAPRDGYESGSFPRLYHYGFAWFLKYTVILVFAHHFFLFYVEVFRLADFFHTLVRVIMSTLFSSLLIVISQYFIFRK